MDQANHAFDCFLSTNRRNVNDHLGFEEIMAVRQNTAVQFHVDGAWFRGEIACQGSTQKTLRLTYHNNFRPGYVYHDKPDILLHPRQCMSLKFFDDVEQWFPIKEPRVSFNVDDQRLSVRITFDDWLCSPPLQCLTVVFEPGVSKQQYTPTAPAGAKAQRETARRRVAVAHTGAPAA